MHAGPSMCRAALAAITACFALAAGAAEITLFEYPGFAGGQLTLRGYTPNIGDTGFNDRTSSIVVTSGRWELCTEADFRGSCVTLTRGEYPSLDRRLDNRISSARETGSYEESRGSYNDYGRGSIELYGRPGFGGPSLQLDRDVPALAAAGFNDRASSVIVVAGTWQLCSDDGFSGNCRTYAPGRYADLGYGMAREISSARLVRAVGDAPAVRSPGSGGPYAAVAASPGRIILYRDEGLIGGSLAVSGPLLDATRNGIGGFGAASVYVESGTWTVCADPNFHGACVTIGPGRYDSIVAAGLGRPVLSVRPAAPSPVPVAPVPVAARREGIELFEAVDFGGERFATERDVSALDRGRFNDRAASAIVYSGQWEFCVDFDYRGGCTVFGPGRYPRLGGMTHKLSSVRRLQ